MVKNRAFIPAAFIFGLASILYIWLGNAEHVSDLTREDGIIESLSAMFYLAGLLISIAAVCKSNSKILPILWVILCFIFLGEETSWFQRIFHYSVSEVEQINEQKEFNLHNLPIFQGGNLSDSSIELSDFLKSQNLFRLGFFGYFLAIPLLIYIPKFKKLISKIAYKKPDTAFTLVLLVIFATSFILAILSSKEIKSALAETREMLYAFFIMLYVIAYVFPNAKTQPVPKATIDSNSNVN